MVNPCYRARIPSGFATPLLLLLFCSSPALAADASSGTTAPPEDPLETLEQGRAALDAMDFAAAGTLLGRAEQALRATDLRTHRSALLAALGLLAAAHLFADDEPEAKNTLRALLTLDLAWDYPMARRTPELAALLETVRTEVRGLLGTPLEIVTTPAGATVILDGLELGQTPLTTEPLLPGRHVLASALPGFLTRQEGVFVAPGVGVEWILVKDPTFVAPAPKDARPFLARHRTAITFGGAALGAGLTAAFALGSRAARNKAWETPQIETGDYARYATRSNDMALLADLFFYVTVASAALGGVFAILGPGDRKESPPRLVLTPVLHTAPGSSGAALFLEGRF